MGLYDALNPERAILYLNMKDSYDEIYGDNLLTDPNNSSLWLTNNATLSSVTGPTGGQAIRVSYAGSGGNPYIYRAIGSVSASKKYRIGGWIKDDNVVGHIPSMFFSSTYGWTATSISGSWYQMPTFDVTGVASFSPQFKTNGTSGAYSDWADCFMYELRRSCKNQGKLGPATVQLGDGFTGTSFPTLVKNGMSFDGTDYINCGTAGETLVDNFTIYAACNHSRPIGSVSGRFMSRRGDTIQWDFYLGGSELGAAAGKLGVYTGLQHTGTTDYRNLDRKVFAAVISGGFLRFYANGVLDPAGAIAFPQLTQQSLTTFIVQMNSAGTGRFTGTMYSVALFPEAHSEIQIKEMTRRMMQNKSIG